MSSTSSRRAWRFAPLVAFAAAALLLWHSPLFGAEKPVIIVLLDSWGKLSRIADANRIKHWIETDVLRVSG